MKTNVFLYLPMTLLVVALLNPCGANAEVISDTIPGTKVASDTVQTVETLDELEQELDALDQKKSSDTTKIRIGKMNISIAGDGERLEIDRDNDGDEDWGWNDDEFNFKKKKNKDRFDPHWSGFSIGWNNYMTKDQSLTLPDDLRYMDLNTNTSLEVNLNITELGINLVKDHIGLVTGAGFRWNNYKFSNTTVRLTKGASALEYTTDSSVNTNKSKLTITYLTIPLMIEFQVPVNNNPLYLAAGVEGALKLEAHTKWKTDSGSKGKTHSDYYINPFSYVLAARVGYDGFGLYGSYSLMSLFKENEGPELYPFTLGISFNF